jgi:hypothetical protein
MAVFFSDWFGLFRLNLYLLRKTATAMRRFVQIDGLRGLFLVVITLNHLNTFLYKYTYEPFGFISAAEGFVFLSGLVAGLVYTHKLIKYGREEMLKSVISRSLTIYTYHSILYLSLFLLLVVMQPIDAHWTTFWISRMDFPEGDHFTTFLMGLVLLYLPKGMDILPMYFVFLLLLPLAIRQFQRGKAIVTLLISFGVWAAAQFGLKNKLIDVVFAGKPMYMGYFDVFGYQLLFMAGAYIGYCLYNGKIQEDIYGAKFLIPVLCISLFFFTKRHGLFDLSIPEWQRLITKVKVGPLRLVNFATHVYLIAYLLHKFPSWMRWRPLVFLGEHSLQVFSWHLLLLLIIVPYLSLYNPAPAVELLVAFACLLSLFLPAYLHQRHLEQKKKLAFQPVNAQVKRI